MECWKGRGKETDERRLGWIRGGPSRRKGVIQPGQGGGSPQGGGCTPGRLPSAPAVASNLCFPERKPGRSSCHRSTMPASLLQFPSCSLPHEEGRSCLLQCVKTSLFHFNVSEIEFIDFIRLLVHTPYAFSLLS